MDDSGGELPDVFRCPDCGGRDFAVWMLPHPLVLHWVLNPGLAFNELVLGQRIPDMLFFCESGGCRASGGGYVHCPGCGTFQDAMTWSRGCAFGNWLGLVCPDCGGPIPTLWNLTSRAVLAVTAPLWWLPARRLRPRYLGWARQRAAASRRRWLQRRPA